MLGSLQGLYWPAGTCGRLSRPSIGLAQFAWAEDPALPSFAVRIDDKSRLQCRSPRIKGAGSTAENPLPRSYRLGEKWTTMIGALVPNGRPGACNARSGANTVYVCIGLRNSHTTMTP